MRQLLPNGIHAIVLAGGAARRFGGGKLSTDFRGRPLIAWAVDTALALPVEAVRVVLGAEAEAVRAALRDTIDPRLAFAHCADWSQGLSASLSCGIAALPSDATGAMIFLGDMPDVPTQLARRVLAALAEGARAANPVCQGRPAHPVGISSALFPAVRALSGDRGARELLQDMSGVEEIATDDAGSTFDIDTLDDHRAAS